MSKLDFSKKYIVADGAFGTYHAQLSHTIPSVCELDNIDNSDLVEAIHNEYISAGAKLIRTNTFLANTFALQCTRSKVSEIIKSGWRAAVNASNEKTLIFASIGPIVADNDADVLAEYLFIVDCFMEYGAKYFIFETFGGLDHLEAVANYIKSKNQEAFIITSFAFSADGYTRNGIGISNIVESVAKIDAIDMVGFNCGSGPAHLYQLLKKLVPISKPFSVMPNAGYAGRVHERTVFTTSPDYFGRMTADFLALGASIIGGCCGTTPEHIRSLAHYLHNPPKLANLPKMSFEAEIPVKKLNNNFNIKLNNGDFVIAVELDPPYAPSADIVIKNARLLREAGADIITVADSPLARPGIDPVMLATKIKREVGIDALPHICCRDRNITALKSVILAGYMEGIRNILAVTGDPVPESDRGYIKGVFNTGSLGLIELITQLNKELFKDDEVCIGGALNVNAFNPSAEAQRAEKKLNNGTSFFMTQPIFDTKTTEMLPQLRQQGAKVLAGIMPIVSYRNAVFLNNEIPGISVPQMYIDRFTPDMPREESIEQGLEIAVDIAKQIRNEVDGFYFITPFNKGEIICSLIGRLRDGGVI